LRLKETCVEKLYGITIMLVIKCFYVFFSLLIEQAVREAAQLSE